MDPLATLSLACNVMQAIQFSLETVQIFRRLKDGVAPDDSAQKNSESLVRTTDRLRAKLSTSAIDDDIPSNSALVETCDELILLTDVLREQSKKCLPKPTASKLTIFWKSFAYQFVHRDTIAKLAQQLDRIQKRMELEILVDLQTTLREKKDETTDRLGQMDGELQQLHKLLLEGHTRLHDLVEEHSGQIKKAIADEGEKTRQYTDQRVRKIEGVIEAHQSKQIDSVAYQRFLDSFRFLQFNERPNMIEDPCEDTFEWIFKKPYTTDRKQLFDRKWDSFPDWLHHGKGPYWISGKAGAGKSTLMKFIIKHDMTKELLSRNNPNFIVISAYVWSAGGQPQRTLAGVLCTFLHQLFSKSVEMYEYVITKHNLAFSEHKEFSDWSLKMLQDLFSEVVRDSPRPICMFVDGLDEIDRSSPIELRSLMKWLDDVSSIPHIKLCVSSRMEDPFEKRFSKCHHLRIQDLTANDIGSYVSSSLLGLRKGLGVSRKKMNTLVHSIVAKAEGVFLWVHLVVEHIRMDADLVASWTDLERRVDELPKDLYPMYETMWNRQHGNSEMYRAETAYYLNALLGCTDYRCDLLICLMLEKHEDLQRDIFEGTSSISPHLLLQRYSHTASRVKLRCGGLISCRDLSSPIPSSDIDEHVYNLLFKYNGSELKFSHRSARDFLTDTPEGQKILSFDETSGMEHNFLRARIGLCYAMMSGNSASLAPFEDFSTPTVRDFQDPVVSSATFELIVQACHRKPDWGVYWTGLSGRIRRVHPRIAMSLYLSEFFRGHIEQYLESCPPDYRPLEKGALLSLLAEKSRFMRNNDSIIQQIESMSLEELSRNNGIFPYAQLAAVLFNISKMCFVGHGFDGFKQVLLRKCGGINSLITWRVLAAGSSLSSRLGIGNHVVAPTSYNRYQPFGIVEKNGRKEVVTLTETSMLHAYTIEGGHRPTVLQALLDEATPRTSSPFTSPPKVVMLLELTLDQNDLVIAVSSKPIRGAATSELLLTQIEKHRSTNPSLRSKDRNQKATSGESLDCDFLSTFSLSVFYDQYEESELNSRETLEYLIHEGYMSPQLLKIEDPLRVLVSDVSLASTVSAFENYDWSVQVDQGPFQRACEDLLEKQRELDNPASIAPCKGGMIPWKAMDGWARERKAKRLIHRKS